MNLLDGILQDDNDFGFFDSDTFAESVTFRPWNGTNRTIKVIVNRSVDPTTDEIVAGFKEVMLVSVANHATRGISITAFTGGKDRIDLSYRPGEAARTYVLQKPVDLDSMQLLFRVY